MKTKIFLNKLYELINWILRPCDNDDMSHMTVIHPSLIVKFIACQLGTMELILDFAG